MDRRRVINNLIFKLKADIFCFQETKLVGDITDKVKQLWGNRRVKFAQLEPGGTRGGILIMWDSKVWEGKIVATGAFTLTCKFVSQLQDLNWNLTGVYAPNCDKERQEVWWEIGAARGLFNGPWVLAGDFHIVRFPYEKRNCVRSVRKQGKNIIYLLLSS